MALSHPPTAAPRNRLLAVLPPQVLGRLWSCLEQVELPLRQVLHAPDTPIGTVYFPETGWISMITMLEDGDGAEVGLVGREGMVGLPVLLGSDRDDLEAMVQGPGMALSMGANAFRAALDDDAILRNLLLRYALVHHGQVARTAACNGRHHTEERLARWLLMAQDRSEGNAFPMTHEFLSMILGIRRAGITVAAGILQKAGLIRYERGWMQIEDRPGLENAACECYGLVRRAYDRLLGPWQNADGAKAAYRR